MSRTQQIVLPESACNLIRQLGQDSTRAQFAIGNVACELVAELYPQYLKRTIIAAIAKEYGSEAPTVQDRYWVCSRWDDELQAQFDMFSYYQAKAIASAPDRDSRVALARWALESADQYGGRVASSNAIRKELKRRQNNGEVPADPPWWMSEWEELKESAAALANGDVTMPKKIMEAAQDIVHMISDHSL